MEKEGVYFISTVSKQGETLCIYVPKKMKRFFKHKNEVKITLLR